LAVTHKTDPNKSFVAKGELGIFIRGDEVTDKSLYKNMLGHANDCMVLEKKNGIVKLLVTSMLPTEMATCFVDLNEQTVRLGKRVPIVGFSGWMSSSQKLANGKIMLRGSGHYWLGDYSDDGIVIEKFSPLPDLTKVVHDYGYAATPVYQADWYEKGYLYTCAWLPSLKTSLIIESIPADATTRPVPSNRYWVLKDTKKMEIEKVWMEDGELYACFSQNTPNDNFIIKLNWKE